MRPPLRWTLLAATLLVGVPTTGTKAQEPTVASQGSRSGATAPPVTDLQTLLERASAHYPGIVATRFTIDAAEARLDEARISPFMQFNLQAGFTVAPNAEGTSWYSPNGQFPLHNGWSPVATTQLRGFVPLYTFGKIRSGRRAARAGILTARLQREVTLNRVRYDVRRAYFALQLSLDAQVLIRDGLNKLERASERLEEMLEDGDPSVNLVDRYRLAGALAEVRARLSEAERLEASSAAALRMLTGLRTIRVPECPLSAVPLDPTPLERHLEGANTSRPEVSMLRAAVVAREAALDAQFADFFPMIGLGVYAQTSYGPGRTKQNNPFITDPSNRTSLGGAVLARWNLDLWGNHARVRRSRALLEETREQAEEAMRGIELEVTLAYEQLEDTQRRETAWAEGERQTRAWFVSAAQGMQLGTVEPKDLIDAMKAYFTARFSHLEAIRDFNTTVAQLEQVTATQLVPPDGWEPSCGE